MKRIPHQAHLPVPVRPGLVITEQLPDGSWWVGLTYRRDGSYRVVAEATAPDNAGLQAAISQVYVEGVVAAGYGPPKGTPE